MKNSPSKYNLTVIIICSIIFFLLNILSNSYFSQIKTYALPFISGYFAFISILAHTILTSKETGRFQTYINRFMLTTGAKFIIHLIAIVIFTFIKKEQAVGTIISFGIYYLALTSFETISLLKLKKQEA